jgi:predicted lipid-binding transport protein (Tim44 family)
MGASASLYESRLSRVIARNIELLEKRQAARRESTPQTQAATAASQSNQTLTFQNGFDQKDSPQPAKQPAIAVVTLDDIPKAA